MAPGLIAGALGALAAVLLSLPLHSPDDIFLNSLTVGLGTGVLAVAAGALWSALGRARLRTFEAVVGTGFLATLVAAFLGESLLSGLVAYAAPLAAVAFGAIAVLTPMIDARRVPTWSGAVALVVPLGLGVALMGQVDTKREALALPSTAAAATSTATATASTSATAAASGTARAAGGAKTAADVRGVTFVVGEGSQSQFVVREKLAQLPLPNDATMKNAALTGRITLDGRPSTIEIDLTKFSSDQPRRDQFIRQQWSRQPMATVTIDSIGALPASYTPGETVKQRVSGRISILGKEAPIAFEVEARMDADNVLSLLGTTSFTWSELGVQPPNTPSVQVQDTVQAQILLVAKPGA
ncbi:MAG: YceI family protein [Dehalococcoidia bacterium]